jgi:DNA gyrase/topoisomerase IV subunit B
MNSIVLKSEDIEKLKFPDNIRRRPGMYTDDIDTGNVLFRELVDNTVDLILKKQISLNINSRINLDQYHYVMDNGIGLPTYSDPDFEDQPITIDLLSNTHVGSNFNRTTYSIGMNGVN